MSDKKSQSRLFRGKPNQVLLDERVSRIVLPTLGEDRDFLEDQDDFLQVDEESSEETQVLQIFVGSSTTEVDPSSTWNLDDEDDDPFDLLDDSNEDSDSEPESAVFINLREPETIHVEEEPEDLNPLGAFYKGMPLQPIIEIDEQAQLGETEQGDDWDQIKWDEVTLKDILGEDFQEEFDFDDSADDYGMKLDFLENDIPEPLHLQVGFFEEIDETQEDHSEGPLVVMAQDFEDAAEEDGHILDSWQSDDDEDAEEVTASWNFEDTAWMEKTDLIPVAKPPTSTQEAINSKRELEDQKAWKVFGWVTLIVCILAGLMWFVLH